MRKKRDCVIVFLMGVMGLSLIIGTTVFIAGCGKVDQGQETSYIPKEPPRLIVTDDGGKSVTVSTGSANWTVHNTDGTDEGGVYCGVHPLEMKYDEATLVLDSSREVHELTLEFEVEPDSWEIIALWPAEYVGNSEKYVSEMKYSDAAESREDYVMLASVDGNYIYEVWAEWDREECSGYASYCFRTTMSNEMLDDIGTE